MSLSSLSQSAGLSGMALSSLPTKRYRMKPLKQLTGNQTSSSSRSPRDPNKLSPGTVTWA